MSALRALGIRPVINATGPWTKMGNAAPSARVRAAMDEMAANFAPFADLQAIASRRIAHATGAEAGYVTSGAAAGITLSVAACVAGEDPNRIKALPSPVAPPNTVVLFEQHRWFYDVAVRVTGVHLRTIDAFAADALDRLAGSLGPDVACLFYDCTGLPYRDPTGIPPLEDVVRVARASSVRVVVDASMALPPPENLRAIVGTGADAVAFSGGKAIQGPPASGFVACRRELVRSIALQQQDLNVWAEVTGTVDPDNLFMGIGRGLKVGKEQIIGLLVALQEYTERDHASERRSWRSRLETVERAVAGVPGVTTRWQVSNEGRAPYLMVGFDGPLAGLAAAEVSQRLLEGEPRIFIAAHRGNVLWVGPETLRDDEVEVVAGRLSGILRLMGARAAC